MKSPGVGCDVVGGVFGPPQPAIKLLGPHPHSVLEHRVPEQYLERHKCYVVAVQHRIGKIGRGIGDDGYGAALEVEGALCCARMLSALVVVRVPHRPA